DDGKRKGYSIRDAKDYTYGQDSPKEDYILCPLCEAAIGQLEANLANNLTKKIKNPSYSHEFPRMNVGGFDKVLLPTIENKDLKQAILSMLFRAHITTLPEFSNCNLSDYQFALVRDNLCGANYNDIPIIILTSFDQEYTKNIISTEVIGNQDIFLLFVNDYIYIIAFNTSDPVIQSFKPILLKEENPPFLGIVLSHDWNQIRETFLKLIATNQIL